MSGGLQSSIDLSRLNVMPSAHPAITTPARAGARSHARGHGHPRRISQARTSRSSVHETINEERTTASLPPRNLLSKNCTTAFPPISIVNPETESIGSLPPDHPILDDEREIVALRRYCALRDEAHDTVAESKRQWLDTPFSVSALQC